jgi:class 3 adenylate cyclase
MARLSVSELLDRIPAFQGCAPETLAEISPQVRRHIYEHTEVLCHQGAEANELFVIVRGQVTIYAGDILLVHRGPNELVGEQAFIEDTVRGATARADGMVEALIIPRSAVERLFLDPAFARNLMYQLSRKLAQATADRAERYRYEHLLFGAFRSHVSPEVLQELLASDRDYGEPRIIDAIILFADIRGFTERSARMDPKDIAFELTAFLDHAVDTVHKHGGTVDKFIGDAMLAVWGGLEATGADLATQAFECACRLAESAAGFELGGGAIELGVGLSAGDVFMGIVGGEKKRQFTVLGPPVNLAARYQGLSSKLGAPVVIGPDFLERLDSGTRVPLRKHRKRKIKGAGSQTLHSWRPSQRAPETRTTQEDRDELES